MNPHTPNNRELHDMAAEYFRGKNVVVQQPYIHALLQPLREKLQELLENNPHGINQQAVNEAINHILLLRLARSSHQGNY